jgi:hypothetical protein
VQQTFPTSPPLSEACSAANAFAAELTTTTSTATLPRRSQREAAGRSRDALVIPLTQAHAHLQRLQLIQGICEYKYRQPRGIFTATDILLALRGRERHVAPLFWRYQLSLAQVRETLLWAEEAFGQATLLEDIIQVLVARIGEEQYLRRLQTRERSA